MSRRNQMIALGVLLAVLGVTLYFRFRPSDDNSKTSSVSALFSPINVDNPALRLDVLQRFLNLQYKGAHRNIFVATLPPPPPPPTPITPVNVTPAVPAGPPPLNVEAKYFGFVSDSKGSHRRAFFATSNNEEVFVAGEGDTLLGRFRVVKLTATTADLEEVSSGRRATLTLEEAVPNG
ncbi:MAG: hypothetical protein JWN92_2495 [Candidatus Acidoferrum typicum]|jgi:hypothetical protein|nr:hypothetical protein [Candidatus Acidoferrum typicum]